MPHQGHYPEEEEEEDDITEIREGEDSSDYYDNYEQNYDEHAGWVNLQTFGTDIFVTFQFQRLRGGGRPRGGASAC